MVAIVEESLASQGLAFVMHGLGGFKEQPHIRVMAEAFKQKGLTVVTFDTTNSIGESDGKYEDATTTNYYEDLEDVIVWASRQPWYKKPFYLAGHSLGGICTALFSEKYPDKVKALAPISTVVSGKLSTQRGEKKRRTAKMEGNWLGNRGEREQARCDKKTSLVAHGGSDEIRFVTGSKKIINAGSVDCGGARRARDTKNSFWCFAWTERAPYHKKGPSHI